MKGTTVMPVISFSSIEDEAVARVLGRGTEFDALKKLAIRAQVKPSDLLKHLVRESYSIDFDAPASDLRACIESSKRDAEKWGTQTQA